MLVVTLELSAEDAVQIEVESTFHEPLEVFLADAAEFFGQHIRRHVHLLDFT